MIITCIVKCEVEYVFIFKLDCNLFHFQSRPTEMILDLQDPDGGSDKLGQICAVFTVQPKNFEDRQEVCGFCLHQLFRVCMEECGPGISLMLYTLWKVYWERHSLYMM